MRCGAPRWIAGVAVAASLLGLGSPEALGQGEILLSTGVPTVFDAPVLYADGSRIGPDGGYTAQLYVGPEGASVDELMPLLPTTVFRSPPLTPGYVRPVTVVTPYQYGAPMEVVLRVYNGASWETSTCRGESQVLSLVLAGPLSGPTNLRGLQSFSVNCVPEPTVAALGLLGTCVLVARRCHGLARTRRDEP